MSFFRLVQWTGSDLPQRVLSSVPYCFLARKNSPPVKKLPPLKFMLAAVAATTGAPYVSSPGEKLPPATLLLLLYMRS